MKLMKYYSDEAATGPAQPMDWEAALKELAETQGQSLYVITFTDT